MIQNLFNWLDKNRSTRYGYLANQLMPIIICILMFIGFMAISYFFIHYWINPFSQEKISFKLQMTDIIAGFLLYFLTAIDYALVIGRMQITNTGSKARFIMNVFTCIGCFVGVSLVLFLWGFAKEIPWLIIPILIFAGSVMVKLAFEGQEYFIHSKTIPKFFRKFTELIIKILYAPAEMITLWMPEIGRPHTEKMSIRNLAKWSFLLPFIIGTDDLVGYMGAMTIYNVFGLLFGIYLADIIIDLMIFISPSFTKKLVENPTLSLFGAYAFLYLAYKSYHESYKLLTTHYDKIGLTIAITLLAVSLLILINKFGKRKKLSV